MYLFSSSIQFVIKFKLYQVSAPDRAQIQ